MAVTSAPAAGGEPGAAGPTPAAKMTTPAAEEEEEGGEGGETFMLRVSHLLQYGIEHRSSACGSCSLLRQKHTCRWLVYITTSPI